MSTGLQEAAAADQPPDELAAIAQRMLSAINSVRILSLSLHDEHADVLWLTESVLGPDEHEAVRASLEVFAGEGAPTRYEYDLGDGRIAITLRAMRSGGSVLGVVMIIVDHKAARSPLLSGIGTVGSAMQGPLDEFAKWLSDDLSATQLRLRALTSADLAPAESAPMFELQLEPDPGASPAPTASPAPAADSVPGPVSSADPGAQPVPASVLSLASEPGVKAAAPAGATAAAKAAASADATVDPMLDRHFAALRAQPIVLYVQQLEPMVEGSRIRRYEVLLRTDSEHGRAKAPTAMLEAAAKRGLGSVIDRRVVTDLAVWLARNAEVWRTDPIALSINLSPTALTDPHFCKFLEACITKADLPRGMIGFELDATLCAHQAERTSELAQLLAALGCTVTLDDFALQDGHVELLGLKGLRMLKLHPRITTDIGADKRRQAIVAGIAQMACVLGMHTCAKAIESKQDSRWLAALKVDFAQGYGFAMPKPLAELAAT
jgi:EAL domain-containing protein (putative c-di-GMP-specific phosphodiesterase class I)